MEEKRVLLFLLLYIISLSFFSALALGAPISPDLLNATSSSRREDSLALNTTANAGNVTGLDIHITWTTQSWQGYFGNVSGTIVLDDSGNKSMYAWQDASPLGEIYAVRSSGSVGWADISCADLSEVISEETALNIAPSAKDGINETFNKSSAADFYIGSKHFSSGSCPFSQFLFENDAAAVSNNFEEIILNDGSMMVYASILNQDKTGFDSSAHDFQMLVPEDGHNGDTTPTNYYFYVEIG